MADVAETPASTAAGPRLEDGLAAGRNERLRAGGVVLRPSCSLSVPEVLLVSRRRSPTSYTVPAGKFEHDVDGGSLEACALRETMEEAGITSEIIFVLGVYCGVAKDATELRTHFFLMRYCADLPMWVEESERTRCWARLDEAEKLIDWNPVLKQLFQQVREVVASRSDLLMRAPLRISTPVLQSFEGDHLTRNGSPGAQSSDESEPLSPLAELPEAEDVHEVLDLPEAETDDQLAPLRRTYSQEPAARDWKLDKRKFSLDDAAKNIVEDMNGERFCFYGNQVGGHFCLVKPSSESKWISVKPPGQTESAGNVEVVAQQVVLKPLIQAEHRFYEEILGQAPTFAEHIARLFGTKTLSHRQVQEMTDKVASSTTEDFLEERKLSHQYKTYIVLQDLASSMAEPWILDLKMGFKQRSKSYSLRKRERCRMKAMNTTSHTLGFRVCGMKTEDRVKDKYWGRQVSVGDVLGVLAGFFLRPRVTATDQHSFFSGILAQLRSLRGIVSELLRWRFWNTSLLFVFDGADPSSPPQVRMIDFAHCTRVRSASPDEEFLCSLTNLETYMEAIRDGHPHDPWVAGKLVGHPPQSVQDAQELESDPETGSEAGRTACVP